MADLVLENANHGKSEGRRGRNYIKHSVPLERGSRMSFVYKLPEFGDL